MKYKYLLIFFILLNSCSHKDKELQIPLQENDAEILTKALKFSEEKKFKQSIIEFEKLKDEHPYSNYSGQALVYNAYLNFELNNLDKTISILNEYLIIDPNGKFSIYAQYMTAMCYYVQISDPRRDGKFTKLSIKKFESLIKKYPSSKYSRDARLKLEYLKNYLATKEFEVGMYYLKNNAPSPAIKRFSFIIENYQGTSIIPQTLYRIYEAFLMLGLKENAKKTSMLLKYNFPKNKWSKELGDSEEKNIDNRSFYKSLIEDIKKIF